MDVTKTVVKWLIADAGINALVEVPNPRPSAFAVVSRSGGGVSKLIVDAPTITIDCWASTLIEANELADKVINSMFALPYGVENVFSARVNSRYESLDPDSGTPRVCLYYELVVNS